MKSRTQSETTQMPVPNGPAGYGVQWTANPLTLQSVVTEDSITWDGNGRNASHYCTAHKQNHFDGSGSSLRGGACRYANWRWYNGGNWKITGPEPFEQFETFGCATPRDEVVIGPTDSEIADRISSASVRLASLPIAGMMNLPQAIIELKDIPKTIRAVPRLVRFLKKLPKGLKGLSYASTAAEVAAAYLAYVFGVRPTAHDVSNFMGQVPERVGIGVRRVQYHKGQKVRVGFSLKGEELNNYQMATTTNTGVIGYYVGSSGTWTAQKPFLYGWGNDAGIALPGVTKSWAWPNLASKRLTSRELTGVVYGRVAADFSGEFSVLDDIGFNSGLMSTAWELVPFSFVVDWFADIGKWLREANKLNAARRLGFSLDGGCWVSRRESLVKYVPVLTASWSESPSIDTSTVFGIKFTCSGTKTVRMCELCRDVNYNRHILTDWVKFPSLSLKGLSNQGTFQWASGTALAIQACSH